MRRVTDDAPRDRAPVFSPDGRSLYFYSARDGQWAVWTIGLDGSNLRRIVGADAGAVYTLLSPKADAIAFLSSAGTTVYTMPIPPVAGVSPTALQGTEIGGKYFSATGWSPDGKRLSGILISGSGRSSGVASYDLGVAGHDRIQRR